MTRTHPPTRGWFALRRFLTAHRAPIALAVLAPSIPELLTGSTPITTLFFDPLLFLIQFAGIVALYGGGALLIREVVVRLHRGWGSILLLGAAYGIGEEGFAVHTFFESTGAPVNAFATYGHAGGVDWLWALGLTVFHATYSIALPILLVGLLYPEARGVRWFSRRGLAGTALVYLAIVTLFAVSTGHGPGPVDAAVFGALAVGLIALALVLPAGAVRLRPGPGWAPAWVLVVAGSLPFDAWTFIDLQSARPLVDAWVAAGVLVAAGAVAWGLITQGGGGDRPDWVEFHVALGMLGILFFWDVLLEFAIPGILLVTAVFVYFLYRLRGRLTARWRAPPRGASTG